MNNDHAEYLKMDMMTREIQDDYRYTHKWYEILGLKREEDSHHIAYSIGKLAESVAKLHDVVMALDARVAKLEGAVAGLHVAEAPLQVSKTPAKRGSAWLGNKYTVTRGTACNTQNAGLLNNNDR